MSTEKILTPLALGSDHRGFVLKTQLVGFFHGLEVPVIDFGTWSADPVDYPDIAADVAESIRAGFVEKGILICGTGLGMAIAANKVPGIFAAPVWSSALSRLARQSNNTQIITIGADFISFQTACEICLEWLSSGFRGDGSARKIDKILRLERRYNHG